MVAAVVGRVGRSLVVVAATVLTFPASATEEPEAAEPVAVAHDQPPIAQDEKRAVPDYDGRGEEPLTAGDVLVWIPRALLYPIYALSEWGIRWPLRQLVTWFDSTPSEAPFWTFGPGNKSGVVPSAVLDFGFRPSIGLYFYSDDALADGLGFASHFAYGGPQWFRTTGLVRYHPDADAEGTSRGDHLAQAKFIFSHRPDWIFYGLGPESTDKDASRYQAQFLEGTVKYEGNFWRSSYLLSWTGVRDGRFEDEGCCDEPMIGEAVQRGFYPSLPPLFQDGYTVGRTGFAMTVDTREPRVMDMPEGSDWREPSGTGLQLESHLELMGGLRRSNLPNGERTQLGFVHYGGAAAGFVDVYNQRTLGLEIFADFVDPVVDGRPIPFTELVSLGGSRPMRGFLERRLLDRSALVATLSYSYPIWTWLDGGVHYAVGNVFGKHLRDFDPRLLRQSVGFGFRGTGNRDNAFEFLVAFGSNTFFRGGGLDTFRLVIGARDDFPLETK
jgi:hypothetical protein